MLAAEDCLRPCAFISSRGGSVQIASIFSTVPKVKFLTGMGLSIVGIPITMAWSALMANMKSLMTRHTQTSYVPIAIKTRKKLGGRLKGLSRAPLISGGV